MAAGSEALNSVKATEPTQWLAPSPDLSEKARAALKNLFSSIRPFTPKSPFDQLLVDGFDAEQIWQQIDIQSQPLISSLRRELKRYEKNPAEIKKLKVVVDGEEKVLEAEKEEDGEEFDEDLEESDEEEEEDDDDVAEEEEEDEDEEEEEEEEEEEKVEEEGGGNNEIEDGFFNIKALGKYLKATEAEEYENDKEDEEEDGEGKEEEDDAQELMNLGEAEDDGDGKDARYEDFFGKKELSTHEKQQLKLKSEIEQREKANMDPKTWTMRGEVTATKRPPNSALEVDLDFEHNVRPAPPITEEVTVAVEDMIRKRIEQELFDDVQRAPALPTKAPRERKEMDENKSKKGLAEDYEQEYLQKMNADSGPLSSKDKQKNEAEMLFRKLCLKLDALSHFHFTPKPVIEDMSIQDNVPALVMEEIAPVAVSDAAMLAPEEVFSGKGDIKEEAELTQAERKRRRANKKRKFKAVTAKRMAKKPRDSNKDSIEAI